jgi:hypothetical protein
MQIRVSKALKMFVTLDGRSRNDDASVLIEIAILGEVANNIFVKVIKRDDITRIIKG